jgi:protein SCO1/2
MTDAAVEKHAERGGPTGAASAAGASAAGAPGDRDSAGERGLHERVARLLTKPWFWVVFVVLAFAVQIGRAVSRPLPKPPALHLPLPAFTLTDQRGQPFGLADLKGKVWVADFVFTSCPTVCPKLTRKMREIQHRARNLGDVFHLVTFSVDPANDTPAVLAAYAAEYHADTRRWTFLTGPLETVEPTVIKGFKIAMGKEDVGQGMFSIFHGEKLVLVDRDGNIRGYYDADDEGTAALLGDIGLIANLP